MDKGDGRLTFAWRFLRFASQLGEEVIALLQIGGGVFHSCSATSGCWAFRRRKRCSLSSVSASASDGGRESAPADLAFICPTRVEAVERPEASGGQLTHLVVAERQIVAMLFARAIGDDQRWPRIGFRFLNRFTVWFSCAPSEICAT